MLIIETGEIVPGADSFATAAELVDYAASFGATIPVDEVAQESLLRRAALQMASMPWQGGYVSGDQALAWPRQGVVRFGFAVPHDSIPAAIKQGQMALAAEIHADDLDPPEQRTGAVKQERVEGAVTVQYADPVAAVTIRQSAAQFAGYLGSSSQMRVVRA